MSWKFPCDAYAMVTNTMRRLPVGLSVRREDFGSWHPMTTNLALKPEPFLVMTHLESTMLGRCSFGLRMRSSNSC